METEIDKAFDWLVMILSTLTGAIMGLPETMEAKKAVALGLVPPLLVLVVVWLFSHLTARTSLQIVLKSYAWFHSSFLFFSLIHLLFYVASPLYYYLFFHYAGSLTWVPLVVFLPTFIIIPFLFYIKAVQPKYRQIYTDSKFLASRTRPVLVYILSFAIYLLLMLVFLGGIERFFFEYNPPPKE